MDTIQFISFIQDLGFTGLLIILAIPSLRKRVFNGNNGKEWKEIKDNHLHEIQNGVNDVKKGQSDICRKLDIMNNILSNIEKYGIKTRND